MQQNEKAVRKIDIHRYGWRSEAKGEKQMGRGPSVLKKSDRGGEGG